ncbi:hypothetical protein LFL96_08615 [Paraburkholderia sp. D15]|uniref:hypothetical protein n=1 Tax=Paraburkholderia sp. D15 TaxID=2880218 RepID=UPI00247A77E2|nr:hypothetical protein [Paraburkholderia sp. D15]WGS51544.1 hypothetical protein LFL96_08615 [Paraburkholderia sp. D15]WKF55744.1 hypothetical protein HUO10_000188 [Paraburkholderia busanensis]
MSNSRSRWLAMSIVASLGIGASSIAFAHVDVGVNIGVPGVVYAPQPAPEPVYAPPPPPVYAPAPPVVVVAPGWYGERYYDGHRYWERREWEARHRDEREWHDARGPHGDWHGPRGDWHGPDGRDGGWHGNGDH